ncbi:hypothetical protein [Flavilitoribacter nigricans]|uniref:Porin n=1 Tax=Flavilitoribacter nigricans (strain ATCC 23147 / DSM 23189 / NBRC 102662 / NCIMB 1420 / SS-2) TaxID=1122177 RepID=A0A2D0N3T0_FLAN2|nr:hypothetical protein [Flavilitoribacter nigricans]PHN03202.1 hypothetical protein CRP01_27805 [Flavilitoribacter nigricans DSM 23189 = NBRC 102662]
MRSRLPLLSGRKSLLLFGCLFFLLGLLPAQTVFQFNALGDLEFSRAGDKSHYYYNEIDAEHTEARLGISQLNLLGKMDIGQTWSFNARLSLERDLGRKLDKFSVPQLYVQWVSDKRKFGLTAGRFVNPFGSFNEKQLSTDRNFIGLPLAYSYYVNISERIGFLPNMGDVEKIKIGEQVQWGSANLYYGGYATGAMFSWNIKPAVVNWKIAVVNGAANAKTNLTDPWQIGLVSRLQLRPVYFWEQGISFSRGAFMQSAVLNEQLSDLSAYTQTVIGTDFKLGSGFFELSGELMRVSYTVPEFDKDANGFDPGQAARQLNNLAVYLDLKYEPPVLPGSYIAYRIDHLNFSRASGYQDLEWDNDVLRHSLAIGYDITSFLLVRAAVSTQHVDRKSWDNRQRTFRLALTAHY